MPILFKVAYFTSVHTIHRDFSEAHVTRNKTYGNAFDIFTRRLLRGSRLFDYLKLHSISIKAHVACGCVALSD